MQDLLSDINAAAPGQQGQQQQGGTSDEKDDVLASLERELAGLTAGGAPPGLGGGGGPPGLTAASLVVSHTADRARQFDPSQPAGAGAPPPPPTAAAAEDAWALSLAKFSSLEGLADDFVAADSAKKQAGASSGPSASGPDIIDQLFDDEGAGGGYDINEKVTLGAPPGIAPAPPPAPPPAAAAVSAMPPPPPGAMPPGAMPPQQPPPHPSMGLPPTFAMMQQQQQQQQQMMMQQQMIAARQAQLQQQHMMKMQQQAHMMAVQQEREQHERQRIATARAVDAKRKDEATIRFKKKDFPSLGGGNEEAEEREGGDEDDGDQPLVAPAAAPELDHSTGIQILQRQDQPTPGKQQMTPPAGSLGRVVFSNPDPAAPPIDAKQVQSALMTPRDLCYVVHSMMRPLMSLDAYNDDYYRWGYDDRRSRNLLMLGGSAPQGNNLPNPVWKETKVKAQQIEYKYRTTVEKRAETWAEKKHVLGRNVKVNVKRPKALLATSGALSTSLARGGGEEEGKDELEHDLEDRARLGMWTARVTIDKGYLAYLNLLETRRLLQSQSGPSSEAIEERRAELTSEVEDNVNYMHSSLGMKVAKVNGGERTIEVDKGALARTLGLPKGRMLLSRILDEGVLPHSSACRILPGALGVILSSSASVGGAPPRGEDRLVRSLTGLVRTVQPSLAPEDPIDCLSEFLSVHAASTGGDLGKSADATRSMLGGQRSRMELLHAILSRGSELCCPGTEHATAWKAKEAEFMSILSTLG